MNYIGSLCQIYVQIHLDIYFARDANYCQLLLAFLQSTYSTNNIFIERSSGRRPPRNINKVLRKTLIDAAAPGIFEGPKTEEEKQKEEDVYIFICLQPQQNYTQMNLLIHKNRFVL